MNGRLGASPPPTHWSSLRLVKTLLEGWSAASGGPSEGTPRQMPPGLRTNESYGGVMGGATGAHVRVRPTWGVVSGSEDLIWGHCEGPAVNRRPPSLRSQAFFSETTIQCPQEKPMAPLTVQRPPYGDV